MDQFIVYSLQWTDPLTQQERQWPSLCSGASDRTNTYITTSAKVEPVSGGQHAVTAQFIPEGLTHGLLSCS